MSSSATDVDLREATLRGLRLKRKELPTLWLYDVRGSQLYEKVTQLPEYYLPAREREILSTYAFEIAALTRARTLVELGAGKRAQHPLAARRAREHGRALRSARCE